MVDFDAAFVAAAGDRDAVGAACDASDVVLVDGFAVDVALVHAVAYFGQGGSGFAGDFSDYAAGCEQVVLGGGVQELDVTFVGAALGSELLGGAVDEACDASEPVGTVVGAADLAVVVAVGQGDVGSLRVLAAQDAAGADVFIGTAFGDGVVFDGNGAVVPAAGDADLAGRPGGNASGAAASVGAFGHGHGDEVGDVCYVCRRKGNWSGVAPVGTGAGRVVTADDARGSIICLPVFRAKD